MRRRARLLVKLAALGWMALALMIAHGHAQQPDPANQALALEWQALSLQQHHAEAALNHLIQSYEARLATALQWLQQAQQQPNASRGPAAQ